MTISMIWHGKGPQGRVVRRGEPISFPKQTVVPIAGASYSYINQAIPGAASGAVYHNAPNLTLDIHSLDLNGNNHFSFLETLPIGCTITINGQSALMPVKPAYVGGGMWNLTLDAWPAMPNGAYTVAIALPPAILAAPPVLQNSRELTPKKKKGKK